MALLFGKRQEKQEKNNKDSVYLLMDSNSRMLARGTHHDFESQYLFFTLIEGDLIDIEQANIVQVVPQDKTRPPQMTRYAGFRNGIVALDPMREAGAAIRKNFRVPVAFDSYVYPASGPRSVMRSVDLSCGGIAFHSPHAFAPNEVFEVVVPLVSEEPLLLRAEALRGRSDPGIGNFYACKFIDLIDDEESLLREAVFAIQIKSYKAQNR